MTDEAADIVYAEIQKTDILTGAKLISFEDGMAQGLIEYVVTTASTRCMPPSRRVPSARASARPRV